jgi:plastocyanin
LLLFVGDLARIKQTKRHHRRYIAMPSSSSSATTTPTAEASSKDTSSNVAAVELQPGDTVEFDVSRISSVRV